MGGEAKPETPGLVTGRDELGRALLDLVVEPRQLRVARVGSEGRGHPVHADVEAVEIVEDRVEAGERGAQVRPRLPAARVMGGQAALAEDLDGEAEPHRRAQVTARGRGTPLTAASVGAQACEPTFSCVLVAQLLSVLLARLLGGLFALSAACWATSLPRSIAFRPVSWPSP